MSACMTKYCWSFDEEGHFTGDFDSREDALAEAAGENYDDNATVYIGEVKTAKDILTERAGWIGERVFEFLEEYLYEDIGDAVEYFKATPEQHKVLATLIIDHIEKNVGFNCFGVSKVTEHVLPVVESEEVEV